MTVFRSVRHRRIVRSGAIGFFAVVVAAVTLITAGCNSSASEPKQGRRRGAEGAAPVVVATAAQKNVPVEIDVVGNVEAYSTISVRSQVGGVLTDVHFHEGDFVKKGDPLFTIDPRTYQSQLKQAEANLARDKAALAQARANLARDVAQEKYARSQSDRYAQLFSERVMSREQTEQARSSADAASQAVAADRAAIESAQAEIDAAQAALESARLQLEFTNIRSPIDGSTGNLLVKQGNVVTPNSMDLTTINQIQPIYVTFAVPEAHLAAIKQHMSRRRLEVTARPQDNSAPEVGYLSFVDNTVDPSTGTIKLKGTFANPAHKLWPGQFVRVTLRLATQENAVVVPNAAVQTGQDGPFVYVVKGDRTVEMRPVVTGARVDQDLVIQKGLSAGETIVTEGQLRLAPGSHVRIRDAGERPEPRKRNARTT
jgi:multidrug efflux system membrane fusion protein